MNRRRLVRHAVVSLALLAFATAVAPTDAATQTSPDSARIAELERRLDAMSRELERLDLGEDVVRADSARFGLGPGASKVYQIDRGVSIGGYGEFLYENYADERQDGTPSGRLDRLDALRAIIYVGYKFDDRFLFNSEIEVEHADEIFLEFAYLDYQLSDEIGVRAGMLLAPLGLVNELHEPPVFLGSERPVTEQRIIPTTWRENGFGVFGGNDRFSWRVYMMNALDGADFSAMGVRGGRQKGSKALAEDFGFAARVDFTGTPGLLAGLSAYSGGTAHVREVDGSPVGGRLDIWDAHVDYRSRGVWLRGLIAGASISEAAELNALAGLAGNEGVGTGMLGWVVQAGYDVLRGTTIDHELFPYVGYERVNTQRDVAPGFFVDPATEETITSLGLAWKPIPQIIVKADLQLHSNAADTGVNQWNVNLGWLF